MEESFPEKIFLSVDDPSLFALIALNLKNNLTHKSRSQNWACVLIVLYYVQLAG